MMSIEQKMETKQMIEGYDKNGILRFKIKSGDTIPKGIIIGKGWILKIS